ncbi:MAG: Daunorubicin/doxorubicin resistance ATP-binding protein DrrA [Syntrophus sp. PtaB.Bin001]|nr:MAG: Daunorubicin/doxorubicin resistance ATP-binding protein DrrA [Syntrophus sp. PtaB.Bin001]
MTGEEIIKVSRLTKIYNGSKKPAVDDLSFVVREREIFGLLGPNGAGKSTTIMALCGLLKIDSGNISVFGLDVRKKGQEIRREIGVAPQEIALFPTLTAYENLSYFGRMYGLDGTTIRRRAKDFLELFGLTEKANSRVIHFSGGMKRRLNLITALLHSPRLLILDEPTSGVDVQSRKMILDYLLALKSDGITVIYSSHLLEEAEKVCSRFAILDVGRLISEGKPADLLAGNGGFGNLEQMFLGLTGRGTRD